MYTPIRRVTWLRLPFGIGLVHEEFQRRQREVIDGLKGVINIVDDILVFGRGETYSETATDHDANLIALLQLARERNLKLNRKTFKFNLNKYFSWATKLWRMILLSMTQR